MFIQIMLARASRIINSFFKLQHWGCSHAEENGKPRSQWSYFIDFGPAMAIIRDGEIRTLMGAFTIIAVYDTGNVSDQTAPVVSCKPLIMTPQKGDKVIFGRRKINSVSREIEIAKATLA